MRSFISSGILFFLLIMNISFAVDGGSSLPSQSNSETQNATSLSFFNQPTGNPSVYPRVKRWIDPFIIAEFTYWQIQPQATGYFRNGQRKLPNSTLTQGKITQLDYQWEPGFKIALGGVLSHGEWDLLSRYTYVNTTISGSTSDFVQGGQTSFNVNVDNGQSVASSTPVSAKGYLHARLNAMDLELGRKFFNSRFLALRFFAALKGIWVSSNDRYTYGFDQNVANSRVTIDGNNVTGPVVVKDKNSTWGIGPRAGIEGNWYFIQSLSIFARLSLGPIFKSIDTHSHVQYFNADNPPISVVNIKNNDTNYIGGLSEIQLGLEGEWWLYDETYKLTIRLLYEIQEWDGVLSTVNSTEVNTRSVGMQGITASMSFLF